MTHLLEQASAFNTCVFPASLQVVLTVRLMRCDFDLSCMLPQEMHVRYVVGLILYQFLITLISADNHQICRLVFCLCAAVVIKEGLGVGEGRGFEGMLK